MTMPVTVLEFLKQFPDDAVCLEHLMNTRYGNPLDCPKCCRHGRYSRIRKIPAYQCSWCGHHIHPMAGTPFEKSRTPLQKWYYAMYLFTTSRRRISARELQRQLSVTYKTAWRIGNELRKYMGTIGGGGGGIGGQIESRNDEYLDERENIVNFPGMGFYMAGILDTMLFGIDLMYKIIPVIENRAIKYLFSGDIMA
jgi:transposase-like protein